MDAEDVVELINFPDRELTIVKEIDENIEPTEKIMMVEKLTKRLNILKLE